MCLGPQPPLSRDVPQQVKEPTLPTADRTANNTDATSLISEFWREYVYPDGTIYRIDRPVYLWIFEGKSGWTQRVSDEDGVIHRPTPGWTAIRWKTRPSYPAWVA